jgi:ubiquinone/menaquinone biosynthesis C-methylase UbiE
MNKPAFDLRFRLTALGHKFRRPRLPGKNILKRVRMKRGSRVLDYGRGSENYIVPPTEKETTINEPAFNLHFRLMSLGFKFRDLRLPRKNILKEVGIKPGFHVLDYGCGPGSYIIPLTELVGESGKVYALDIHPLSIRKVQNIASKKKLANVRTILSDCKTGLHRNSLDVVLLYDVLHHLSDRDRVLKELHRVLKPDGILSFSDHHMKEREILAEVTNGQLFRPQRKGRKTYTFLKK